MPFQPGQSGNPDTQFKPGESGNPAGKKPGTKHLSTWIQELLNDEKFEARILDSKIGIKDYTGAPIKAIIEVAIVKAVNGDQRWADWLAKHGYGTKIDLGGNINHTLVASMGELGPDELRKLANLNDG